MTGSTEYNKIVSTVTSVTQDYQYFSSQDSCIVIDTSNNNIGINNINPTAHIDISGLRHDDAGKILKINGQSYFEYVDGDYIIKEKFLQLKVGDEQISEVRTAINKMQTITISGGHEIRHETGTNYLIIDPSGIDIN